MQPVIWIYFMALLVRCFQFHHNPWRFHSVFTLANFSQKSEVSSLSNLSQSEEVQLFRSVFQSFGSPPSTKSLLSATEEK